MFYKVIISILKLVVKKPDIRGFDNVDVGRPGIFVANHMGYYGPLKIMLFSKVDLLPWVISEVTDKDLCADYLRRDFIEPTLKLRGWFGGFLSRLLAPLCVGLMEFVEAIPVYHGRDRIKETFELSVKGLKEGRSLLIFPEYGTIDKKYEIGEFQSGFVKVAQGLYDSYGVSVVFYPVCVDKVNNRISYGEPVVYNSDLPFREERKRITGLLRARIVEMSRG